MIASVLHFNSLYQKVFLSIWRPIVLITALGFPLEALSQMATRYDSMDIARDMLYDQKIPEAILILEKLDKNYPLDEHVMLLYSQALYWNNDFSRAIAYIKSNTIKNSYPESLDFHFGKILFELYYLTDADRFLSLYLKNHPDDVETLVMLAKIAYWQGKSKKDIINRIEIVLKKEPNNAQAIELKEEILLSFSPELSLYGGYYNDSQPLQGNAQLINFRFYRNAWFQPSIQFNSRQFNGEEIVFMPSISNKSYLPKSKTEVELKAGVFSNSWSEDFIPTWTIGLKQKTVRNIEVYAEASRIPYLFTLSSIAENVVPTVWTSSIGRESGNGITGKIMAQQWNFNDDNKVKTLSAWVLLPLIKQADFTFNLGYAFTLADSDHNRFMLDDKADMPSHATFGQVLPGIFNPYFTPQNQVVHAALGKFDVKVGPKISASINSNIGVYAHIENPNYVYYGTSNPTAPIANPRNPNWTPHIEEEFFADDIYKIFVPTRYFPLDLRGKILMEVNRVFSMHTGYTYVETIFFKSREVNLGLKWKLASR